MDILVITVFVMSVESGIASALNIFKFIILSVFKRKNGFSNEQRTYTRVKVTGEGDVT